MKKVLFALFALVALVIVLGLALPVQADVVPTIWTDKTDYAPEETVTIYGAGFEAGGQLTVEVTRPDGWVDAWSVTADDGGAFETSYLLDGIEGLYTVVATDGTNTATTTFTDKFNYSIAITEIIDGTGAEHPVDGPPLPPLPSPITLKGNASGTPYLGQYDDHHVQVEWGDNHIDAGIEIDFTLVDTDAKTFQGNWTSPSHIYPGSDDYTIVVKLYHGDPPGKDAGVAPPETITIEVVNAPPVAANDAYSVDEDDTLNVAAPGVLGNDTDVDGDTLTAVLDTGVSDGTLTLNGNGSFSYDPAADFYGSDSFTYHANDGTDDSNTATVTITINPTNDAPVAVDDAYSVDEDNTLNVAAPGVLGNDTDVDGDTLTAVLDTGVSDGTLTLNGNGSFSYDPAADFYGSDSFTYKAYDGSLYSDPATVTVTVNPTNDAPVAADDSATTNENAPVNIDVLFNDSDPDGDPMMVTVVSDPPHGSTVINLDYTVTYTPDLNYDGADSFTYTVSDGTDTDTGTVSITVNPAPAPLVYGGPGYVLPVLLSIEVTPEEATIAAGEAQRFRAVASYSGGTTRNVTAEATWVSSDNNVATVDAGLATGVAEGTTGITATLGGVTSNEATLSVTAPAVVSVEVAPESGTIGVGDTVQFAATATYSDGTTGDITGQATWDSSDTDVATVDAGLATGVAEGSTEIRATFDGVTSDAAILSVTTAAVVSIEVALESGTIGVGDTVQFTATATYSDGTTGDITGQATWNSSDPDVATINAEGLATGEGEGTIEITATLDGVTSDPVTLTVTAAGAALQWWAILAIVAGSLALALLLFTMLRRRRGLATGGS